MPATKPAKPARAESIIIDITEQLGSPHLTVVIKPRQNLDKSSCYRLTGYGPVLRFKWPPHGPHQEVHCGLALVLFRHGAGLGSHTSVRIESHQEGLRFGRHHRLKGRDVPAPRRQAQQEYREHDGCRAAVVFIC